jgi:hypothetical protein
MKDLDSIALALFDKIRARFDHVNLGDKDSKSTTKPEDARFFNFDYISKDGENFGNITMSLVDEKSLKVYYSTNISTELDPEQQDEWSEFLNNLRHWARRNMLTFDVRDINRSNLDLRDIRQQTAADSTFIKDEVVAEAKLYGTSRSSYANVGPHKLIIRHKDKVDSERHGARSRQIEHVFIETPLGERFLLDHVNLHGARATANHLTNGGSMADTGTALINEMVKEMSAMKHFVRSVRKRTFEDSETVKMVESAVHRYNEIRDHLKRFQGRNGHQLLMQMVQYDYDKNSDDFDEKDLRERFVKKIYDDRFNEALPYVYRAYKNFNENSTAHSKEFESWANTMTETAWDNDINDSDEEHLLRLMDSPITVGVDGQDAVAAISTISFLDSEDLSDSLIKLSRVQGPDTDARRTIIGWLAANGERALAQNLLSILQQQNANTQPAPQQPVPARQPVGATGMDEPVVSEDLITIIKLAGLN